MFSKKRALIFGLRLFLLPLVCFSQDNVALSGSAGTLFVDDSGGSGYWRTGISANAGNVYASFELGRAYSDLPFASIENKDSAVLGAVLGTFGFDTDSIGVDAYAGFFEHDLFKAEIAGKPVSVTSGLGKFFGIKLPVHIGRFSAAPSFFYGAAAWDSGDLYWFFGKPDIPKMRAFGLSAIYAPHGYARHTLSFHYADLTLTIQDNDNAPLFASQSEAVLGCYTFAFDTENFKTKAALGYFYAHGSLEGALTSTNQHYFLFPYTFYHVNGDFSAHAGFVSADMRYNFSFFSFRALIGIAHIFSGNTAVRISYKEKKLFGGRENSYGIPGNLSGIGMGAALFDFGIPALRIRKTTVSLGIQKVFAIPWGYERLTGNSSTNSAAADTDAVNSIIRTALLSGWSFYTTIRF
jgi:hypothetical protein